MVARLPMNAIPTRILKLSVDGLKAGEIAKRLRGGSPAVIGRVADDQFIIDPRTVQPHETDALVSAVKQIIT